MADSTFNNERCVRLPCHPTAPRSARILARCVAPAGTEATTELVASELVTNAVLHARSEVELAIFDLGDRVRIEVSDESSQLAPLVAVESGEGMGLHGRGLHLVGALATAWGSHPTPGGKTVWCEISAADRDGLLAGPSQHDKN